MQLSHNGLSLPIPLPMWYYNHCFRFSDNTLHPAFTRTVFPASPSSPKTTTTTARVTNTGECTAVTPTAKSDATWRSESKPKKNSFSIEAILDIESNPSTDRGTINESKVAVSVAERRRHRLFENPHPYIAASYTTNHHPFANTQLPVCQDSKNVSLEEGVSSRVAGVVHDWKRQHHHHSHHSQQQPPQHIEPHTSVTLPRAPSKNSPSTKGGKRVRTIFTPEQLEQLETEFSRQQYMVGTERYYLAGKLALSEVQVKVWFQNRRIKMRKQQQEAIKEHFAQCRYMNASESEEEDDEEEENDDAEGEQTPPTQQQQQQQQSPRMQHRNRPNDTAENQRSSD